MNNQDQLSEEEIINPEQFQVGRNPEQQDEQAQDDEAGYTPGETEFADGDGTRLAQESEELDTGQQADDLDDPESDEEDADFENPEDDPA